MELIQWVILAALLWITGVLLFLTADHERRRTEQRHAAEAEQQCTEQRCNERFDVARYRRARLTRRAREDEELEADTDRLIKRFDDELYKEGHDAIRFRVNYPINTVRFQDRYRKHFHIELGETEITLECRHGGNNRGV